MKCIFVKSTLRIPWLKLISAVYCFSALTVTGCNWENNAADDAIDFAEVTPLARMVYTGYPSEEDDEHLNLGVVSGVSATVCCGRSHTTSGDGDAANAIDNNLNAWWHPSWDSPYSDGHKSDSAVINGNYTVANYINEPNGQSGVQNGVGGHWITIDLGSKVENLAALGYIPRNQGDRTIRDYEVWVSDSPIGWDTTGAALVAKGSWTSAYEYHYARFVPVAGRYIQLRQIYNSASPYGCISNLIVQTSSDVFPGLDTSLLETLYLKGLLLLETLDKSNIRYENLKTTLESTKEILNDESLKEFPLAGQSAIDAAAVSLQDMINLLDPPRTPPEVY
jgi:hypothetical protein